MRLLLFFFFLLLRLAFNRAVVDQFRFDFFLFFVVNYSFVSLMSVWSQQRILCITLPVFWIIVNYVVLLFIKGWLKLWFKNKFYPLVYSTKQSILLRQRLAALSSYITSWKRWSLLSNYNCKTYPFQSFDSKFPKRI